MRLEYFQLIDRIVELDLPGRKISSEAVIPAESTIFEGHFPGYPLMPGVLLIETMAQTAGWLVVAANRFERMPFLAAVKEAKNESLFCAFLARCLCSSISCLNFSVSTFRPRSCAIS